jgi:hypothetical protein
MMFLKSPNPEPFVNFAGKLPGESGNDQESNHGIIFCLREKL